MNIRYLVLIVLAGLTFQSCTDKIDTLAPYKEVCLIWSFLDKSETTHYVVVQKGFVNPNQDAYVIAQNPDSLYFNNIDVKIQETKSNGNPGQSYTLNMVDLSTEGIAKDTGTFTTSANYAYRFDATLDPSSIYTVTVTNGANEFKASTPVLNVGPNTLYVSGNQWTDTSKALNFTPSRTQKLFWTASDGAMIFDGILKMNYFDVYDASPQDTIAHVVKWRVVNKEPYKGATNMQAYPGYEDFVQVLNRSIPAATTGLKRYLGLFTLEMYAGSERLANYITLQINKGGLSANQVTPEFTEGFLTENTYGLFDTRGTAKYPNLKVNDSTIYYLRFSQATSALGFEGFVRK